MNSLIIRTFLLLLLYNKHVWYCVGSQLISQVKLLKTGSWRKPVESHCCTEDLYLYILIVCMVNSKNSKNVIYGVKRWMTISHNNMIINEVEQLQTKIKRRKFLQCITSESNISGSCRLSRFFSPLSLFAFTHILFISLWEWRYNSNTV